MQKSVMLLGQGSWPRQIIIMFTPYQTTIMRKVPAVRFPIASAEVHTHACLCYDGHALHAHQLMSNLSISTQDVLCPTVWPLLTVSIILTEETDAKPPSQLSIILLFEHIHPCFQLFLTLPVDLVQPRKLH